MSHWEAPVARAAWDADRSREAARPELQSTTIPTFWASVAAVSLWSLWDWAIRKALGTGGWDSSDANYWPLAGVMVFSLWLVLAGMSLLLLPLGMR